MTKAAKICLICIGALMIFCLVIKPQWLPMTFGLALVILLLGEGAEQWLKWWFLRRDRLRLAADGHRYLIDTACLLHWETLAGNIDRDTADLLTGLLNQGCRNGLVLQSGLKKAASRLKNICRLHPDDPGPVAYRGWCLALLGRIAGRENAGSGWDEFPENRLWRQAEAQYMKALALAPQEASLAADWGRLLENRGFLLSAQGQDPSACFQGALKHYEAAVKADPDCKAAWRGQGRILARQVMELGAGPALVLLEKAVDKYELARNNGGWDWDFYEEFAQVTFSLAQYHPTRAVHYFCYSARLFAMASEMNGDHQETLIQAGRALNQAAYAVQEQDPRQALGLYRESLVHFRSAIRRDGADAYSLMWAARSLTSLYTLAVDHDLGLNGDAGLPRPQAGQSAAEDGVIDQGLRPGGGSESRLTSFEVSGWLEEAAEMCARAAAVNPSEEILSDWANVLSLKAEKGGTRAADLWAATARKYAAAIAGSESPDGKTAVNWHNWGYALSALAESQKSPEGRFKLLGRAAAKYEKAASMNGNNLITLKNWGDVLGDMAELADDPGEAGRLRGEAVEKFEKAAGLYPEEAGPWRRWSAILQRQARGERNPVRRRELWQAALDKLERGVQADSGSSSTWVAWGQTLSELYWEGAEYERPLLISGIIEKYEKALELEADDAEIWTLLGRARLEASELPQDISACGSEMENATAAVESFSTACALAADQAGRWSDWGRAIFRQAQILDNDASALAALCLAAEKYETAVALEPENGEHRSGLGHILYQWGWRLEDQEAKRRKFREAYAHCAEAGRLAPYDAVVWRNWGKVTEAMAAIEKDPVKSFDWQSEADEKFYQADIIDSTLSRDRRH